MVGTSSRGTQRLLSKQKAAMAPHLSFLQTNLRKSSEFAKGDLVPPVQREATLPTHRDDIFAFLKSYKETGASPLGAVMSQQSTSAESQKVNDKQPQQPHRKLLRPDECAYLEWYGREQFDDMTASEHKQQFSALMTNQPNITRQLRAAVIDWLFEVGTKLNIDDKTVLF